MYLFDMTFLMLHKGPTRIGTIAIFSEIIRIVKFCFVFLEDSQG